MGTRGSALALAQSGQVASLLKQKTPGLEVETVVIKTSGDLFATQPPKEIGTKGLFVKEIEEALSRGEIDFAVHSAKDMPARLAEGLIVAAYPRREDPRDVFIGREGLSWSGLKEGHCVATSSLRRKVQLLAAKPGAAVVPLRGNVDTRLRKLKEGEFDGLMLALAGLRRLGRQGVVHEPISVDEVVPAPAQGALALECRADREDVARLLGVVDDAPTRLEVELERGILERLGGGCQTPLGVLARASGETARVSVFWSREDGSGAVRLMETCESPGRGEAFMARLVEKIRAR